MGGALLPGRPGSYADANLAACHVPFLLQPKLQFFVLDFSRFMLGAALPLITKVKLLPAFPAKDAGNG